MAIPKIFVSYSHEDEVWKDQLLGHLRVLQRQGIVEVWETSALRAGDDWAKELGKVIDQVDIAVLLVSPSFLASDFIVTREVPALLQRRQKEGLVVLPVLVRPSMWSAIPQIAELQFLNDPSKPLSSASEAERDKIYASMVQRIADLAQAVAQQTPAQRTTERSRKLRRTTKAKSRSEEGHKGHLFVSHCREDGDFAELLKLRLEREGHEAWVDTDRLDPGLDWRTEIDEALKKAAAVLAIMSPDARTSEYVTYEWAFAWGCGTKVIPVMLRQTTIHPRLATLQYLDFSNRIARPWERLFEVLAGAKKNRAKPKEG